MPTEYDDKMDFRAGYSLVNPAIVRTAKTTTYTAKHTDGVILADATGGGFTITLPACAKESNGTFLMIKLTTATANTVTIAAVGSDTIDGAATSTLLVTNKKAMWLQSDGIAKWFIVGIF